MKLSFCRSCENPYSHTKWCAARWVLTSRKLCINWLHKQSHTTCRSTAVSLFPLLMNHPQSNIAQLIFSQHLPSDKPPHWSKSTTSRSFFLLPTLLFNAFKLHIFFQSPFFATIPNPYSFLCSTSNFIITFHLSLLPPISLPPYHHLQSCFSSISSLLCHSSFNPLSIAFSTSFDL